MKLLVVAGALLLCTSTLVGQGPTPLRRGLGAGFGLYADEDLGGSGPWAQIGLPLTPVRGRAQLRGELVYQLAAGDGSAVDCEQVQQWCTGRSDRTSVYGLAATGVFRLVGSAGARLYAPITIGFFRLDRRSREWQRPLCNVGGAVEPCSDPGLPDRQVSASRVRHGMGSGLGLGVDVPVGRGRVYVEGRLQGVNAFSSDSTQTAVLVPITFGFVF
jgi:hypothetical protein